MKKLDYLIIVIFSFGLCTFWIDGFIFNCFYYSFDFLFWIRYIDFSKEIKFNKRKTAKLLSLLLDKVEKKIIKD